MNELTATKKLTLEVSADDWKNNQADLIEELKCIKTGIKEYNILVTDTLEISCTLYDGKAVNVRGNNESDLHKHLVEIVDIDLNEVILKNAVTGKNIPMRVTSPGNVAYVNEKSLFSDTTYPSDQDTNITMRVCICANSAPHFTVDMSYARGCSVRLHGLSVQITGKIKYLVYKEEVTK